MHSFSLNLLRQLLLLQLCEYHQKCFNLTRLTKRGDIGKDYIVQDRVHKVYNMKTNVLVPEHRFFHCRREFCSEIISKECTPTCNSTKFNVNNGKIKIFFKNNIITAKCDKVPNLENGILQCNDFSIRNGTIDVKDCVNGKKSNGAKRKLDFMGLKDHFYGLQDNLEGFLDYEDLVIHPNVK